MVKYGNSEPSRCVYNILRTYRGEVPYERTKGLDPRHYSRPSMTETPELFEDVKWNIRTYEPRVILDRINMVEALSKALEGDYEGIVRLISVEQEI